MFLCFFFSFFSFFAPHKQHKIICGKHSKAALEWKQKKSDLCPFFLPHQFPKNSRAPASASKRKGSCRKAAATREREREKPSRVARRNNRFPASKQEGAGTHTHPPKKNPEGSWAGFFFFFLGAPNNAFQLSSLMTIFIKNGGPLRILFFFFFLLRIFTICDFLKRNIISQIILFF